MAAGRDGSRSVYVIERQCARLDQSYQQAAFAGVAVQFACINRDVSHRGIARRIAEQTGLLAGYAADGSHVDRVTVAVEGARKVGDIREGVEGEIFVQYEMTALVAVDGTLEVLGGKIGQGFRSELCQIDVERVAGCGGEGLGCVEGHGVVVAGRGGRRSGPDHHVQPGGCVEGDRHDAHLVAGEVVFGIRAQRDGLLDGLLGGAAQVVKPDGSGRGEVVAVQAEADGVDLFLGRQVQDVDIQTGEVGGKCDDVVDDEFRFGGSNRPGTLHDGQAEVVLGMVAVLFGRDGEAKRSVDVVGRYLHVQTIVVGVDALDGYAAGCGDGDLSVEGGLSSGLQSGQRRGECLAVGRHGAYGDFVTGLPVCLDGVVVGDSGSVGGRRFGLLGADIQVDRAEIGGGVGRGVLHAGSQGEQDRSGCSFQKVDVHNQISKVSIRIGHSCRRWASTRLLPGGRLRFPTGQCLVRSVRRCTQSVERSRACAFRSF